MPQVKWQIPPVNKFGGLAWLARAFIACAASYGEFLSRFCPEVHRHRPFVVQDPLDLLSDTAVLNRSIGLLDRKADLDNEVPVDLLQ